MISNNIRIVLVSTSHPGNIGSVARAMKTMGLSQLVLVNPQYPINAESVALAAGGADVLAQARIVDDLSQAIGDCELVLATSARERARPWPMLTPRQAGEQVIQTSRTAKVALVFGRESSGLTNEELQAAHYHVQIPANEQYPVLNIAAAVQIICYEIHVASLPNQPQEKQEQQYPEHQCLEHFYKYLERMLTSMDYIDSTKPQYTMQKLRRLFARAHLESNELKLLQSVFSEINKRL